MIFNSLFVMFRAANFRVIKNIITGKVAKRIKKGESIKTKKASV